MPVIFTDQQIAGLLHENKQLPGDYEKRIRLRDKRGHRERELSVAGSLGHQFRLVLRWSLFNHLDFSVILAVIPTGSNALFRLCRYNGKSHEHTNQLEQERFYDFHIHTATERYQQIGTAEDFFARPTNRYSDFHGALECMLNDCRFERPVGVTGSLLLWEDEES
ncbi:MAG: hypothetical protein HQM01_13830 [Magnetococcales bacterium]|nr:hypothetical protein [Magnetococcales bacterium]